MIYNCCDENRKSAVLASSMLNGIDYLEVLDSAAVPLSLPRQQVLLVHCLKTAPSGLAQTNVLISGGESITDVNAVTVGVASAPPSTLATTPVTTLSGAAQQYLQTLPDAANVLVIATNVAGDFSTYTLRLVNDIVQAEQDSFEVTEVLAGFDPQLAEVEFSFKVECGPNFDCNPQTPSCPPNLPAPPPINYLAKDYGSFRTILLDRMNQLLPSWGATSEADMGIMLAELIAYVGDQFSYHQDAIATEAYIETARSRVSLRRHARLVDYFVHDGCNARVWMQVPVQGNPGEEVFLDRKLTRFYTYAPGMPANLQVGSGNEEAALLAGVQVFEPICDSLLYPELNQMQFYTWGDTNCCLPQGATEATLLGSYPNLQAGDVLIFEEVKGPQTGDPADADIRHRCAVRLTAVVTQMPSGSPLVDPLFEAGTGKPITAPGQTPTPITEIQWAEDDALPFPVCISSTWLDENSDEQSVTNVSIALGNIVLADHGLSFTGKSLGVVPSPSIFYPANSAANRCSPTQPTPVPVRFRPQVPDSPLTQAVPLSVVPLPAVGNPETAGIVSLGGLGSVSLTNADGYVSLTLETTNPQGWPALFGVMVKANGANPANIDVSVVYNPPGGSAGLHRQITVESFTNLSLLSGNSNYAVTAINAGSQLIQVQAGSATAPVGFPAAPTMLSSTGPVVLEDLSSPPRIYMTAQAESPSSWPQLFGVQALPDANPTYFDLDVFYNPPSGAGVAVPVLVEQFLGLSPATVAGLVDEESSLIAIDSYAQTPDPSLSAYDLMNVDPSTAMPEITLSGTSGVSTTTWDPLKDLLESGASDPVFVVEVESNNVATLRFGDGTNGEAPDSGTSFTADYRVGNGTAGNVGADSVTYVAAADARIQNAQCTNPLPAAGGTDPETTDQIRRRAPQAFLTQERAITMTDYQSFAEANPQVDQAVASLRWTGSWYTVFVSVEPQGGGQLTSTLQQKILSNLEQYRLAGQDLQLDSPQYVSLEIALQVCVDPNYFQKDVQQALLQVLGSQILPNGQKGYFFADNFTFGQTVYLSPIYAAARSVPGVIAVTATVFQPQGADTSQYLAAGEIPLGSLQVARLANDPSFPDRGQLTISMEGGK